MEIWMDHRMIPSVLKNRIRTYEERRWREIRGVDEEDLLYNLPRDIKGGVPWLIDNEELLDPLCDRAKPMFYSKGSTIPNYGDPIEELMMVLRDTISAKDMRSVCSKFDSSKTRRVEHLMR
ncbi:hypothetical protein YC2023_007752 [Brassica napus]